jgi:tetratricopeptide (TPR) repeat protein
MSRRAKVGLLLGLVAGLAGAGVWAWRARSGGLAVPEVDLEGVDPAVAAAVESARRQAQAAPGSADAWGRLGMVLGAHAFAEQAVVCLDRAARLAPGEPAWLYLAGVVLAPTEPAGAVPRLREALARSEGPAEAARLRLAGLLLSLGQPAEAEELYAGLAGSEAVGAQAALGLARVAVARGDLKTSRRHLERAKSSPGTAKAARALLAEVYRRQGEPALAARLAAEAGRLPDDLEPADPWLERMERLQVGEQAQARRASRLLRQGEVAAGVALLERAVRDYPHSAALWQALGRALIRAERYPQAEAALARAARLAPDRAEAAFYLGVAAYQRGDRGSAATHFERATRLRPDHALAWYNLGGCRRELGDRDGAIAAYREALRYKPHHAGAHVALARLLAEAGRPAEARRHLEVARGLDPDDPEAADLLRRLPGGESR